MSIHYRASACYMHAERDTVLSILSVRLSVRYAAVLNLNECIYRQTLSTIW